MSKTNLGEQELLVLRYVNENAPVTVRDVADAFAASHGLARTTILTVLERLRAKGRLTRERSGAAFEYRATQEQGELLKGLVGEFVRSRLGGSVSPFVAFLSEEKEFTPAEVDELRALVERLDERGNNNG